MRLAVRGRVVAAAIVLALAAGPALAEPWRVLVDGRTVLSGPAVVARGATLWIELAAAAPALGLQPLDIGGIAALRDVEGILWRLSRDGTRLESAGRSLALGGTAFGFGGRLFLPASTLAALAQRRLSLDPRRREARFGGAPGGPAASPAAPVPAAPEGWQPLVLPKSAERLAAEGEARRLAALAAPAFELVTPDDRASLHVAAGLGHLLDGDWGVELSAAGSVAGLAVSFDALGATTGAASELTAGRLVLGALDRRWTLEAGDVFGELAGASRGLRLSRALGRRWHVDVAAVEPSGDRPGATGERALAGFRRSFGDAGGLLEGEVDSLGGAFGRLVVDRGAGGFAIFGRRRGDTQDESYGANARWSPRRWLLAQAGATRGRQDGSEREEWGAGITASVAGRAALTAERSSSRLAERHLESAALGLAFGLGSSRWSLRYEDLESRTAGAPAVEREALSLFVSAPLGGALSLSYQGRLALAAGAEERWDELTLRTELGPRTTAEVATPLGGGGLEEGLRVRLAQRWGERLELIAETGRLAPFSSDLGAEPPPHRRGVRLLVRAHWDVATPAGGSEVAGRLVDTFGRAVADIPIRLGEYRTMSGRDGRWRFQHVPRGEYDLAVEPVALADRYVAGAPQTVVVEGTRAEERTVRVLEKVEIQGQVCLDRDRDGRCRSDEALAGAVVETSGRFATTRTDGSFFFGQLPPGRHVLRLVTARLPAATTPSTPTEIDLEVEPGRRTGGYLFLVVPVERPIVFASPG